MRSPDSERVLLLRYVALRRFVPSFKSCSGLFHFFHQRANVGVSLMQQSCSIPATITIGRHLDLSQQF
jgi:hypothetical protein